MFRRSMYVHILFLFPGMFDYVTTYYQTLETWIGHSATCYHNFNLLPHKLPQALPYVLPSALLYISLILIWIGLNAMRYHNFNVLQHALPFIFS